ncbi:MAG: hypothetical protein OXD35_02650, partial [Thiotrichales bacterium]|nr:hypothetical protein [Thiotrichales bacterium]
MRTALLPACRLLAPSLCLILSLCLALNADAGAGAAPAPAREPTLLQRVDAVRAPGDAFTFKVAVTTPEGD